MKKILFLVFFMVTIGLFAQKVNVTGKVVDTSGKSIPGINILIKGTSDGTISNFDGQFALSVSVGETLVFSYIGMDTREIVFEGQSTLNVVMQETFSSIDEVVVIGYQTVRKADLTGAVSVFKPDELKSAVVTGTVGEI